MQLTLYTDISLRVLLFLASQDRSVKYTIANLSEIINTPKNHLVKIVNQLGKNGYLLTVRGKGGGIYLGMDARDINIAEVIKAMEKNTEIVDCNKNTCPMIGACKLKGILNQATQSFFDSIGQYSLVDVIMEPKVLERMSIPAHQK